MRLKITGQIGMLVAAVALSGCSKQEASKQEASTKQESSATQEASISVSNIYAISLNGAAYLITEVQNTGSVGVTAFQGTWTISDELGNKVEDQEIKYMSDTPYATPEGVKQPHVVAPGEKLLVVIQSVSGQPDNVFATTEANLGKIGNPIFEQLLKESKLSDYRVTKKISFELEKCIT
jgi:hypothetical protein